MAKRFPLETVRSVVHRRAEDAAAVVRGQAARLQAAEGKLAELERYRDEYRMQRGQVLTEGASGARLREFDAFLVRLGAAVEAQRTEVVRARASWELARTTWQEQHRQEQAFDVLAQRHDEREAKREQKQEQKGQDEFARRVHTEGGRAPRK
ncbi:MAG: flagellar export protein FliJ [Burkholderiales bacterium]